MYKSLSSLHLHHICSSFIEQSKSRVSVRESGVHKDTDSRWYDSLGAIYVTNSLPYRL